MVATTTEVQSFKFNGCVLRALVINGDPWFVGKDVADILELSNTTVALQSLDADELAKFNLGGQHGETNVISEPGLYKLIMRSRKPQAKAFQRWVTHTVLPSIRKHGAYLTPDKLEEVLLNPDTLIKLATQLKEEREGRLIAEQRVNELMPKADYCDLVLADKSLVTITQIAKDYGMSGQSLNAMLHDFGVIYKQGDTWLLYAKYQKTGWTRSETIMVERSDGTRKAVLNTKWTQRGRLGLYELLKKHGVLPTIERDEKEVG